MSIVIDSSAIVAMLRTSVHLPAPWHPDVDGHDIHAPHLVDPEVLNALQRLPRMRGDSAGDIDLMLSRYTALDLMRYPHLPLIKRVWSLRHNVTPYDALYVALAEELELPLVTADQWLARAAERYCEIIEVQ